VVEGGDAREADAGTCSATALITTEVPLLGMLFKADRDNGSGHRRQLQVELVSATETGALVVTACFSATAGVCLRLPKLCCM